MTALLRDHRYAFINNTIVMPDRKYTKRFLTNDAPRRAVYIVHNTVEKEFPGTIFQMLDFLYNNAFK